MPRIVLTVDVLQNFVGGVVYDPYDRVLGRLVSIESSVDGQVENIVVQGEKRSPVFIPVKAVKVEGNRVVVLPEWKQLALEVLGAYQTALKRFAGLEEMYKRGEIPARVYEELRKKLDASLSRLRREARELREVMKKRLGELEDENLRVERAIANLKVSYLAGEISDNVYRNAIELLRMAKNSIEKEVEDIKATTERLENIEKGVGQRQRQQAAAPASQGQPPIPVKIVES